MNNSLERKLELMIRGKCNDMLRKNQRPIFKYEEHIVMKANAEFVEDCYLFSGVTWRFSRESLLVFAPNEK